MAAWQPPLDEKPTPPSLLDQLYGPASDSSLTDGQRLRIVVQVIDVLNGRVITVLQRQNWLVGLAVLNLLAIAVAIFIFKG